MWTAFSTSLEAPISVSFKKHLYEREQESKEERVEEGRESNVQKPRKIMIRALN